MRLSSKTGYGVQALFDMAFHGRGRAVQAREVAERQGVPLRYLEQILQELRRAGFVDAKRGPGGGYVLARAPEQVSLGDVVAALEGPVDGWLSFEGAPAGEADVPAQAWREVAGRIADVLGGVSLQDLVTRAEALGLARQSPAPQMYFI